MISVSAIMKLMPMGVRFHPTEEELVNHYLKHKMHRQEIHERVIPEVDVCKYEPWQLPGIYLNTSAIKTNDQEWFFFCPLNSKYSNNTKRTNRATESGFWKKTGNDLKIMTSGNVIATKKIFVFHTGRGRDGVKTDWVMHEYHLTETLPNQKAFVLCRLRKKEDEKTKATTWDEGEPRRYDVEKSRPEDTIPELPINNQHDGMQSQIGTTEQEEDPLEYMEEDPPECVEKLNSPLIDLNENLH